MWKPKLKSSSLLGRREWLQGLLACGCGAACSSLLSAEETKEHSRSAPVSATEALDRLIEGNRRFAEGKPKHDHESRDWRNTMIVEQHPFAVVVGCSDSRVPPELIFDQGFGDLFVIRNAGNLIATDALASIEYAVTHLDTRLVVVMGHEGCGAVAAALKSREVREHEPIELQATLRMIEVALSDVDLKQGDKKTAAAVEHNVRWAVKRLRFQAAEHGAAAMGVAKIVGAVYDLRSGKVRFLP